MPVAINNEIYSELGDRWYSAQDDPIALLRAENHFRIPWVQEILRARLPAMPLTILDLGCGAGMMANALAKDGHFVTGVDQSESALAIARKNDATQSVTYLCGDACEGSGAGPIEPRKYDVVLAMDVLEHVERPAQLVSTAALALKPGGLFFFYTFNRTWLSWLIVAKGVEWVVKNTPPRLHLYRLFIKPKELSVFCSENEMSVQELFGVGPKVLSNAFLRLLVSGVVPQEFSFERKSSKQIGYMGFAKKNL